MSKAILVIDMPKNCHMCPCFEGMDGNSYCMVLEKDTMINTDEKPKDCPLKHLPIRITKENQDLEIWNSRNGYMLAPKGLFDEIYNDKEDDDEGNW